MAHFNLSNLLIVVVDEVMQVEVVKTMLPKMRNGIF
jgi:hypothetical protein